MLVIGLTGGIGSGKSTVADLFAKLGATIIDTDQLSRDLTQPGQPALQEIVKKFGPEILFPDRTLDRKELRRIIFADKNERQWLEQLLHPLIRAEMKRLIDEAKSPYCIVVIPLLLETKPNPLIQRILVVDTSKEFQIERSQKRDNATHEEIAAIIDAQVDRAKRLNVADDIIENNGSIEDLRKKVIKLHEFYSKDNFQKK